MASLRVARHAFAPSNRQPLGLAAASPYSASLRPHPISATPQAFRRNNDVSARSFHVYPYIDSAINSTCDGLIWLNSLSAAPHWGSTIVAAALGVALIRVPLHLSSKYIANRQAESTPLISAWRHMISADRLSAALQLARIRKRIAKERGCQDWKAYGPVLGIPAWFLMSESLRRLLGAGGGWLSLLTSGNKKNTESAGEAAKSVSEYASTAWSSSTDVVSKHAQQLSDAVEAMTSGGFLWFTDLTVADPTMFGLPLILAGTMSYSFWPKDKYMRELVFDTQGATEYLPPAVKWRVRLTRALLCTGVVVPALCVQLPAGLFLYWITSMWFNTFFSKIIDKSYKSPNIIKPCKNYERRTLRSS
ncbi:Mitochondrial inner membrane protein oxa1-1 [Colletotrichum chlorophyti]|uniref:Mitochondrial inner membrane protein oxa1-1 n=1 Tax=Colletotrichum chlorophyti TaxID=708187 RepID=A0A1Q8RY54_9PEZI|nr:Mitochondrial inner membrane protein oxa1-1 [Colletotrichum chlorophyti]